MPNVLTIGGAVLDTLFVTDKGHIISTPENPTEQNLFAFEYGAKIISDNVYASAGGGAVNIAVSLSRMGLKAAACVCLGADQNGQIIKETLKREKVGAEFIKEQAEKMTGFSFILVNAKDGDHTVFSYRGANTELNLKNLPQDGIPLRGKISKIKNFDWVYITSLTGEWREVLSDILEIKKENPALKIAFNPGATQLAVGYESLKNILTATDILFVNKDEAIELTESRITNYESRIKPEKFNDINFLFKEIMKMGLKNVVITVGALGAYVGNSEKIICSPAASGKRLDTTGAGDAFGSAFLAGYATNGGNLENALKYGIINSNSVVNEYGAQKGILTKEKILEKIGTIKIENL